MLGLVGPAWFFFERTQAPRWHLKKQEARGLGVGKLNTNSPQPAAHG